MSDNKKFNKKTPKITHHPPKNKKTPNVTNLPKTKHPNNKKTKFT